MDTSGVVSAAHVAGPLRLHPFRGLMLAPGRIGDPASARAFARPYRDVAARLTRWERQGHLVRDSDPAVYLHEYTSGGITVRGLVGGLDISRPARGLGDRVVFPHEGVHPVQATELAARMEEMQLNPAPIILVHHGPAWVRELVSRTLSTAPDHQFTDQAGQRHRVWALRLPDDLAGLDEALAGSRALIADGHHRYAAYLRMHRAAPGGARDLGLAMLVDQDDTPLFLGAIHRVLVGTTLDEVRAAAAAVGATYTQHSSTDAIAALGASTLVVSDGRLWGTVVLPDSPERAPVMRLHDDLVPALPRAPQRITHHHTVDDALAQLSHGRAIAVLLPAPEFDLVLRIVASDRLLPEKATSFQPKPSMGVLIRSLRDG